MKTSPNHVAASGPAVPVWKKLHLSLGPYVFILSGAVGVCAGVMAWVLKRSIAVISECVTSGALSHWPYWPLAVLPAAGVLMVVAMRKYFFKGDIGHGVRLIRGRIGARNASLPVQMCYSPLVSSALTLGFGGSAGAEGPMALGGAALASNLARKSGITGRKAMMMMACGAGAGIAAIFQAPVGGALFTLEVLRVGLGSFGVMVLFVTTLIAGLTATGLEGFSLDMVMKGVVSYDTHILPWAIALGLFCGVYSLYYSYVMKLVERLLDRIGDRWIKGVVSGLGVGVVLMLLPALYGEGYQVMGHMLNGDFAALVSGSFVKGATAGGGRLLLAAACILMVKCFITSLSFNGGGVTGEFAPTLFAGCFAGYLFGEVCNEWFGLSLPVSQMALMGMGAVMAGAIRAPMMAMFIVVEMTSSFTLLVPIAIAAAVSFGVVRLFTADSFFSHRLDRNNGLMSRFRRQTRKG